jgi:hypothetical protein
MDEALGQLFGYLVWRDTKAAILLFIRNKDVTAVIERPSKRSRDTRTTSAVPRAEATTSWSSPCTPRMIPSETYTSR